MSEKTSTPPQAPERTWIARWLGPFYVTGSFWFRLHRFGVSVLPEWAIRSAILCFTSLFYLILHRIRRDLASNLRVIMGPCGWRESQRRVFATLKNFAWCVSERYERLTTERRVVATAEGEEFWQQATASGQGIILMTAHIGHWEVGSMLAPSMEQRHVHIVREEETDPQAQAFMRKLFAQQEGQGFTMHFAKDDPMLGIKLLRALQAGEMVAVQGDRPRTTGGSLRGHLFGQAMDLPKGPAALARASGCPILPVFVYRTGRLSSCIVFKEPIFVANTEDREGDLLGGLERMTAEIERAIRREPTQWFCFRSLWSSSAADDAEDDRG